MVTTEYITKYSPATDTLEITIGEGEKAVTGTFNFKEFMDKIPTERARIENLLSKVADVKAKRIHKTGDYMEIIEGLTKKVAEVRDKMEIQAEEGNHANVKSLRFVVQSVLDQKNTVRELRYAIKLLENEEGQLKAELLEMTA